MRLNSIRLKTVVTFSIVATVLFGAIAIANGAPLAQWWRGCPADPPTRTPWPIQPTLTLRPPYDEQPTYTPNPLPTCRPTSTLDPNPSPTPYPTEPPLDTPTPYPTATDYPPQPVETPEPTATDTPEPPTPTPTEEPSTCTIVVPDEHGTVQAGVNAAVSGDTVCVRDGTYYEQVVVSTDSVIVAAYPGEQPVIDAQDTLPGDYHGFLIMLSGDYVTLSGIEIRNVYGTAVGVTGDHNVVRNMKIHHCLNKAIFVGGSGTGNLVESNEAWMTSLIHEGVNLGGNWAGSITAARYPHDTVIRGNVVHETWGIGIQTYEAYNTVIEDNIVWNNQLEHYYVNNAPGAIVRRNLAYSTPDSIFKYKDEVGVGIAFCDEASEPVSQNVTIVNNLVLGCKRGFYFFNQQEGSGLKHFLIAHNTFVDSRVAGIQINAGDHESSRIQNNIIVQDEYAAPVAIVADATGLQFSYNLWSETPPSSASGTGDVVGDPLLTGGAWEAGTLMPGWFWLLAGSPAIDAGTVLSEVLKAFDGVTRPQGAGYDIGAFEQ